MRILVVEDYEPVRVATIRSLREEGYSVDGADDFEEASYYVGGAEYDAVVLDIMLPGGSGLEVLRRLRESGKATPVLLLTARDTVEDRIEGLDTGADDYLIKPFSMDELLARVRALVRRRYAQADPVLAIGHLRIDTNRHRVEADGEDVELTALEYALLEYLARREGQVVSRTDIWEHVYDEDATNTSNVVNVYVGYLRKKLERPHLPKLIHTRRGEGYVLEVGDV